MCFIYGIAAAACNGRLSCARILASVLQAASCIFSAALDAGSFLGAVFRDTLIGCSVPLETTAAHETLRETVLHR